VKFLVLKLMKKISAVILCFFIAALMTVVFMGGCKNRENEVKKAAESEKTIGVFIPGVLAGSAIYEMVANGVLKAAEDFAASKGGAVPKVTVIEGGFNQAGWEDQVTTLAASQSYDLIVSSNPSLPEIVSRVSAKFPSQKFLLFDGELSGNLNVYTIRYNQREQSYMAGYIAALVSIEAEGGAGSSGSTSGSASVGTSGGVRRLGLVAAQEYPVMNNIILPGFTEGAQAADPAFTVDFRLVGNWFDAAKAAELAAAMIRSGVKVIMPIAGGAGHGVIQAAAEAGAKVVWFDINGYAIRPGTVIGSSVLRQDKAAYEKTMLYLNGNLPFGKAEIAGTADGFVDFVENDPHYIASVSEEIRGKQAALVARIRSGELKLD